MAQHVDMSTGTVVMFTTAVDQVGEDEVRRALQAVIERKELGKSSLDGKIVATFESFSFTEASFRETINREDQQLKRHRNGGGWVPAEQDESDETKPFVAETAYVGPFAVVSDKSRVYNSQVDDSRISGGSRVDNSVVSDKSRVYNSRISGGSRVDNSVVSDKSRVYNSQVDDSRISGNSQVYNSRLERSRVIDNSQVTGNSVLTGCSVIGQEICNRRLAG